MNYNTLKAEIEKLIDDRATNLLTAIRFLRAIQEACSIESRRDKLLLDWLRPLVDTLIQILRVGKKDND